MAIATDLNVLVEEFATALDAREWTGEDQEEYSSVLARLEDQAERDEPNEAIVDECLHYLMHHK
jgi:hypothetical protein